MPSMTQNYQSGGWKAHRILIVCSVLYTLTYMERVAVTVVLQPMKLEMGLSDAQLGTIQTVYMLCYGVFAIPAAYLIDRWSRKKSIGLMGLIWNVSTTVFGLARNFVTALFSRAVAGPGVTAIVTGSISMITAAYNKEKHGWAMGIFNIGIPLGIALGAATTGFMAAAYGWRSPFFLLAGIGVLLAVAVFFLEDYRTVDQTITSGFKHLGKSTYMLLKIPTLRWFFPGYGLMLITGLAQINWLPTFLMRQYEWRIDTAGYITCVVSLVAVIGAPLGGVLSDVWYKKNHKSRLWLPAIASLLSSVFLAASFLAFSCNLAAGLFLSLIFGIVNMVAIPALSLVSQNVVPAAHKGLAYGLASLFMYVFGGAWSPLMVGAISDSIGGGAPGLMWAMVVASIGGVLACFCFLMGARYYASDEDRVKGTVLQSED
jgi:predicted MFS family arabinose efflux permease